MSDLKLPCLGCMKREAIVVIQRRQISKLQFRLLLLRFAIEWLLEKILNTIWFAEIKMDKGEVPRARWSYLKGIKACLTPVGRIVERASLQ